MRTTYLSKIEKELRLSYGSDIVSLVGDNPLKRERLSTQIPGLDYILGGGLPFGAITEILGDEGSGKTTLALHLVAECQARKGISVIIDAEHALDFSYAERLGINLDDVLLVQPNSGEDAFRIAHKVMNHKVKLFSDKQIDAPLLIIIDSVAALASERELNPEDIAKNYVSPLALLMSAGIRRITSLIGKSKVCFVFINQLRVDIGAYGNPNKSPGGRALKFAALVRLQLTPGKKYKDGQEIKIKSVKNKTHIPFLETIVKVVYGFGIDSFHSLFNLAQETEVITRKGGWYYFNGRRFRGMDGTVSELKSDSEFYDDVVFEVNRQ